MTRRGLQLVPAAQRATPEHKAQQPPDISQLFSSILQDNHGQLPFGPTDVTAGSESELQAVVVGCAKQVDLPQTIEQSRFFANLIKRAAAGETAEKQVDALRSFLSDHHQVWENSWVRLSHQRLTRNAQQVLEQDLLIDKQNPHSGKRSDSSRFCFRDEHGERKLRLPISYLIKLALADVIGRQPRLDSKFVHSANELQNHYLNDNTSPETFSFHVVNLSPENGLGDALARETAKRFLLTQLLIDYANLNFGLEESGQQAQIYCAPHPPQRQKLLNDMISDAFYRELFMSPCLSGWDRGEDKHHYMHLCHQVLSRSQLNAVAKLREAGIITNNLVVLPNMSNISLANNGAHISLGSRILSQYRQQGSSALYGAREEKYCGDLSIKIQEHFLPLFAANFSAAPYRLGFEDFHPEKALGFLAHELDFTHLRMLWRRWRRKSSLKFIGSSITPFGPEWIDRPLSKIFGLKGDFVPDFRLVDYPVSFLSSEESPALSGELGNQQKLLYDLDAMGAFDARMSLYQFFKIRDYDSMGFSGFEGRHYSLFGNFIDDMGAATTLQHLITALSFKYMADGRFDHRHIPDNPGIESERRQIFFGRALGLPTFFIKRTTRNRFLRHILKQAQGVRHSRRYNGYLRVYQKEYSLALIRVLEQDGADLIEQMGCHKLMSDLQRRIESPEAHSVAGRLTQGILSTAGAKKPLQLSAMEFNEAAEKFYRTTLRQQHLKEALNLLGNDLPLIDQLACADPGYHATLKSICRGSDLFTAYDQLVNNACSGTLDQQQNMRLINLVLLSIHCDRNPQQAKINERREERHGDDTSIYRAG